MTLFALLILVVLIAVLFSIPNVPPLLRNVGAAVLFVVILWIVLSMLGLVPGLGHVRVR